MIRPLPVKAIQFVKLLKWNFSTAICAVGAQPRRTTELFLKGL